MVLDRLSDGNLLLNSYVILWYYVLGILYAYIPYDMNIIFITIIIELIVYQIIIIFEIFYYYYYYYLLHL